MSFLQIGYLPIFFLVAIVIVAFRRAGHGAAGV